MRARLVLVGVLCAWIAAPTIMSGITIDAPYVVADGRQIRVMPRYVAIVREAMPDPVNPTDDTLWLFSIAIETLDGTNVFSGLPGADPACPPADMWATGWPLTGYACANDDPAATAYGWHTTGCYCRLNIGPCPGTCDLVMDYSTNPDDCIDDFQTVLPDTIGASSPARPNTTYRLRLEIYNLDPGVAGVSCIVSPYSTPVTTGWQEPTIATSDGVLGGGGTVTLPGQVVCRYSNTQCWWEWGPSSGYGNTTPVQLIAADQGDTVIDATATISGLEAGRDYHYRLVAQNDGGIVASADRVLTTEYTSPIVTDVSQQMIGTSVVFHATVDPRLATTSYYVQYGTNFSYGSALGGGTIGAFDGPCTVTVTGNGFMPGVSYHWRFCATSEGGTSCGPDCVFAVPMSAAPLVTTGDPSTITATSARIGGSVNPRNQVTSWLVEYGPSVMYGMSQFGGGLPAVGTDQPVATTLQDLTPGTTIHYRVTATNASGTSVGADKSVTTASAAPHYVDFTSFKCRWVDVFNANLIDGHGKRGLARQSTASLSFTGSGIRLYSMRDPTLGRMKVSLDKRRPVYVTLTGPTRYQVPVFEVTGLAAGRHMLKVEAAPPQGKSKQVHVFVNVAEILE